jgi:DNA-binding LytR/AlgR family response regulator
METIKALIVADGPAERQSLRLLIRRLPDLEVVGECQGREDLLDAVRELDADLVLLDAARLPALLGGEPGPEGSASPANGASETMARIEQQLDPHSFVRVHRSTIARVDSVREIKYDHEGRCLVLLSDGAERAASRAGRKRLQEALGFSI